MSSTSEFRAYTFIKQGLAELEWNTANPNRTEKGQVYTQHECLDNPRIKKYLQRDVPENMIIVRSNKYLVVEAKPKHKDLSQAIKETKGYANKLNSEKVMCPIATAVAGNPEDTYIVRNYFFKNGRWLEIEINERKTRGLLSPQVAKRLIDEDTHSIKDFQISDEILYNKATKINGILHEGSINKNYRARMIAAILLAMSDDAPINIDNDAFSLIKEINSKVETVLHRHGKREFFRCIEISTPPTPDNHMKFRQAIIETIQELEEINIRSAMNSGADILGRFYEVFLKYGNGAKEIGIVLTPRHITRFAVQALKVDHRDKVFDPACGTGGFLVAAFDQIQKLKNQKILDRFKASGIYGIEQEPEVVALALVNMIFRGDGKNNIVEGNCFSNRHFKDVGMTKVLMNPPFALKKEDEKEYRFIDFGLKKLEEGGLLFAIVPSPIMFRGGGYKEWRKNLLRNHTLKAVLKLPQDLFCPIGVHTSAIIIEARKPHKKGDKVLWGVVEDGFIKSKGVMFKSDEIQDNFEEILKKIHLVLDNHDDADKPRGWIFSPIEFSTHLECAPEQYLKDIPIKKKEILNGMRNVLLNIVSMKMADL